MTLEVEKYGLHIKNLLGGGKKVVWFSFGGISKYEPSLCFLLCRRRRNISDTSRSRNTVTGQNMLNGWMPKIRLLYINVWALAASKLPGLPPSTAPMNAE